MAIKVDANVATFLTTEKGAFAALYLVVVLSVGLVLEDIGARIEQHWDKKINAKGSWVSYLKLELRDELVGQRYLRTVLTRLKFELAFAPALISFAIGIIWLQCLYDLWTGRAFVISLTFILILSLYSLYESYCSSKCLDDTRKLIVKTWRERNENKLN